MVAKKVAKKVVKKKRYRPQLGCKPNCCGYHYHVSTDDRGREVILVLGMKPYLWIGDADGLFATVSGNARMRCLAERILHELPRRKKCDD